MSFNFLLRVEAVNLASFVYDTQDLNTIRGGGLLLLGAVRLLRLETCPELNGSQLDEISTGASVALLRFTVGDSKRATGVRDWARNFFTKDEELKYATFVVDLIPEGEDFDADRRKLMAMNRHRQMRSLTLAVPEENKSDYCQTGVCEEDRIRPAVRQSKRDNRSIWRSASVDIRRKYGIKEKRDFYISEITQELSVTDAKKMACALVQHDFSHSFDDIASRPPDEARHLAGKIAVIYLDGNGFGHLLHSVAKTSAMHTKFFGMCQGLRREFLKSVLETMNKERVGWVNADCRASEVEKSTSCYRLETLLWGGDEIIWVVPAWQGWGLLESFYRFFAKKVFDGYPLTFAGGVVFANHKAPIQRLTFLARCLADLAKARMKMEASEANPQDRRSLRYQNLFSYEVLESFDHIGGLDLDEFRRSRYGVNATDLVLSGDKMEQVANCIRALKDSDFPRSQIHPLARPVERSAGQQTAQILKRLRIRRPEFVEPINELSKALGPQVHWLHSDQLWDYLP